jgi:DNA mismatch repair protein MutS2
MHAGALRALEFDRIVSLVAGLAVTPPGEARLAALAPLTDAKAVAHAQQATSEGTRFLATQPAFPLRAPADLGAILNALDVDGRALEPLRLLGLADYLESVDQSRRAVTSGAEGLPILRKLVEGVASFRGEIADVRSKIDASGEVADNASPALFSIRDRLRRQKAKLRGTLEGFLRERDTSKYLQEQVVTDRNGRHVLMVRAEYRGAIPGIVHGSSGSGASLFLEPLVTVEINNDIVALEEQEAEEVRRILLELTDGFRQRPDDLERTIDIATELDVVQARARFSQLTGGVEPGLSTDGAFELRGARHPLLMSAVRRREADADDEDDEDGGGRATPRPTGEPVPVDILLTPPARVLVVTGPNTGGKTVALKTSGLFAAMAQAGLHLPVEPGSRLPVFKSLFADIGDEQSISNSLSTFSGHITNVVSMDRTLALPALVLLDEVGAGTDPAEGGALGMAVIDHFRKRGAHLVATTHYDVLKTYASTTEGVVSGAFSFNPVTFAPTYKLVYGLPGRSLAIEIASRLGMPAAVIAAARGNLTEGDTLIAARLERIDRELAAIEQERKTIGKERIAVAEAERRMRTREESLRERETALKKRIDAKLDDQMRAARKEIDAIIEGLKARATVLSDKTGRRTAAVNTGEAGAARLDARSALDAIAARVQSGAPSPAQVAAEAAAEAVAAAVPLAPGVRVAVGGLGLEGVVIEIHGRQVEVDVRGKRLRAKVGDLRVLGGPAPTPKVKVSVDLQPREGLLSELNVIGSTVDDALTRVGQFLDEALLTDVRELRIVHGHGTGQLRRGIAAFLKEHPLVAGFDTAPPNQGGGGATVVQLKD